MCDLEPYYEQMKEYPKEVVETYYNFTKFALDLKKEFGERIFVDVIDVASFQGLWKTIKHQVLKTPCVLIDGEKISGPQASYDEVRGRIAQKFA